MNIQLSVSIWTVICFCLLMLILQNGVFKPVLRVLDNRKQKLEAARAKKEEIIRLQREHDELFEQQRKEYLERKKEETRAAIEKIHSEEKLWVKSAQTKSIDDIDAYRLALEKACADAIAGIRPQMKEVAGIFTRKVIAHLKELEACMEKRDAERVQSEELHRKQREHEDLLKQHDEYAEQKKEENKAAIKEICSDEKGQTESAQAECLDEMDAYKLELGKTCADAVAGAKPQIKEAAGLFARKIIYHRG